MLRRVSPSLLALSMALLPGAAQASERAFVSTRESRVLGSGQSELQPWTTWRVGRERYYSALDGRLQLEHGLARGLQLALSWNFRTRTEDTVVDDLTGELGRNSESEFASASLELKYQLSDPTADALGSALFLETTLGPNGSELTANVAVDRNLGDWLLAANLSALGALTPVRGPDGSELDSSLVLEPRLGLHYALTGGFGLGLELRAPLGVAGDSGSAALFGGPALSWAERTFWAALGVQPQLLAFSGKSSGSRLDLSERERLELRLIAGFML